MEDFLKVSLWARYGLSRTGSNWSQHASTTALILETSVRHAPAGHLPVQLTRDQFGGRLRRCVCLQLSHVGSALLRQSISDIPSPGLEQIRLPAEIERYLLRLNPAQLFVRMALCGTIHSVNKEVRNSHLIADAI